MMFWLGLLVGVFLTVWAIIIYAALCSGKRADNDAARLYAAIVAQEEREKQDFSSGKTD